jgi:copper chaperone CopZ
MFAMLASASGVLLNSFAGRFLPRKKGKDAEQRVTLYVPEMHCEACVNAIKDALQKKLGAIDIKADLAEHVLEVAFYNRDVKIEDVRKILREAGFKHAK